MTVHGYGHLRRTQSGNTVRSPAGEVRRARSVLAAGLVGPHGKAKASGRRLLVLPR
jgi:hypothetical protein